LRKVRTAGDDVLMFGVRPIEARKLLRALVRAAHDDALRAKRRFTVCSVLMDTRLGVSCFGPTIGIGAEDYRKTTIFGVDRAIIARAARHNQTAPRPRALRAEVAAAPDGVIAEMSLAIYGHYRKRCSDRT
jgi:hypothetical protein